MSGKNEQWGLPSFADQLSGEEKSRLKWRQTGTFLPQSGRYPGVRSLQ
jgi:hypothetical protein